MAVLVRQSKRFQVEYTSNGFSAESRMEESMVLSVIIPVFNEAEALTLLMPRLATSLKHVDWEVIFVNDGSTDTSLDVIRKAAASDRHIKLLSFSRNFGHQAAITAGLDFAEGDAVVVMDADLQDPPELLPKMLELYEQGYDVVSPQREIGRASCRERVCVPV